MAFSIDLSDGEQEYSSLLFKAATMLFFFP